MSTPVDESDVEREIDLARLREIAVAQWWVILVGVVVGMILGGLFSLSGSSAYKATARIAPGQAFNPSGSSPVLTYLTNQTAINEIATSEATLQEAAAKAGIGVGQLRGHVTTSAVNQGTAASTNRNAVLVDITVQLNKRKKAEDAANAIADVVQRTTTSRYVRQSISIYATRISNYTTRLKSLQQRIELLDQELHQPGLSLDQRLLLAIQLDQAQATQGQTIDSLAGAQQQQILAQDVQRTQIIQGAKAAQTSARSSRTSILVGALIGLLAGVIAAIVIDRRTSRKASA
jgi:capsular polysaccharide biosynthesis protein